MASGIVRRVDELNRIVIPKEIMRALKAGPRNSFDIRLEGGLVVLELMPLEINQCSACAKETETLTKIKSLRICNSCLFQAGF